MGTALFRGKGGAEFRLSVPLPPLLQAQLDAGALVMIEQAPEPKKQAKKPSEKKTEQPGGVDNGTGTS